MRVGVGLQANAKAAVKYLNNIVEGLENPAPLLNEIADALREASQRQYRTGAGWRKLKPETIKRKKSSKVLVMSGDLEDAFTRAGSPHAKFTLSGNSVSIGTTLGYAIYQGKGRNPSKVNKRQTEEAITEIFDRHMQRARG